MDDTEMVDRVRNRLDELCPGHGMQVSYDNTDIREVVSVFVVVEGEKLELTVIGREYLEKPGREAVNDARLLAACEKWTELQE